jgi:hypothetical protein
VDLGAASRHGHTVHPAGVATTLIVLGLNLMITAFLLNLIVSEGDR